MRKAAKSITLKYTEYIPKEMQEDKDLSLSNPDIEGRPLVFVGRPLTRDEMYRIKDMTVVEGRDKLSEAELAALDGNNLADPSFNSALQKLRFKNDGEVVKFIYDNCIKAIKNVLLDDGSFEELKGAVEKQKFWNSLGNEKEIEEAAQYFMKLSSVEEKEAKN